MPVDVHPPSALHGLNGAADVAGGEGRHPLGPPFGVAPSHLLPRPVVGVEIVFEPFQPRLLERFQVGQRQVGLLLRLGSRRRCLLSSIFVIAVYCRVPTGSCSEKRSSAPSSPRLLLPYRSRPRSRRGPRTQETKVSIYVADLSVKFSYHVATNVLFTSIVFPYNPQLLLYNIDITNFATFGNI